MGIETEYGITVKNQPDFNPILSSLLLINSYETYRSSRIRWDYEAESPLRDARWFEYLEEKEVPSQEESGLINLILSNGARLPRGTCNASSSRWRTGTTARASTSRGCRMCWRAGAPCSTGSRATP
jgi:hypothetical protein